MKNLTETGTFGSIISLGRYAQKIKIKYQLNQNVLKIPMNSEEVFSRFGCQRWEYSITHWAVKELRFIENCFRIIF